MHSSAFEPLSHLIPMCMPQAGGDEDLELEEFEALERQIIKDVSGSRPTVSKAPLPTPGGRALPLTKPSTATTPVTATAAPPWPTGQQLLQQQFGIGAARGDTQAAPPMGAGYGASAFEDDTEEWGDNGGLPHNPQQQPAAAMRAPGSAGARQGQGMPYPQGLSAWAEPAYAVDDAEPLDGSDDWEEGDHGGTGEAAGGMGGSNKVGHPQSGPATLAQAFVRSLFEQPQGGGKKKGGKAAPGGGGHTSGGVGAAGAAAAAQEKALQEKAQQLESEMAKILQVGARLQDAAVG